MSPLKVNDVVNKAEENDHANCEQRCVILNKLVLCESKCNLLLDSDHQKYDRNNDAKSLRPKKYKKDTC